MAGIRHHPLADISDIRSLLDEQYQPSAIIKELLQNADDANASRLFLAVHPGLPFGCHPLLQVPALLVLNDGVFRETDAHAIPYKGLGAKGNDRASIGKFGRGLKSVFHLCEAFFYVASPQQPGMQAPDYDPILNPWENSGFHPEWEGVEKSRIISELQVAVNEWEHELSTWFCLWIPLRTQDTLAGKVAITDTYPVVEELLNSSYSRRIATMFPLMRTLQTVSVWGTDTLLSWKRVYTINRSVDSGRSLFRLGELTHGTQIAFSGRAIYTDHSGDSWQYQFYAREHLAVDEHLLRIRQSDDWPKAPTFDIQTGGPIMDPDKAEQHTAVIFGVMSDIALSDSPLSLASAVFLPLSGQEFVEADSVTRFHLLLHGYFFVDAGRRDIVREGIGNSAQKVCADWNRTLEERVQHGLILPTLSEFVTCCTINDAGTASLTRSLMATSLFHDHWETLCAEFQWISRLSSAGIEWALTPSSVSYWELPEVAFTMMRPWDVLPSLRMFIDNHCVVFNGAPRLTLHEPKSWSPYLTNLLTDVPVKEVFTRASWIAYLVRFLEAANVASTSTEGILALVRKAFAECEIEDLRANAVSLRDLVRLLPSQFLIPITANILHSLGTHQSLRQLATVETDALLVPHEFMPEGISPGRLSLQDGSKVLHWLERTALDPRIRSNIAVYFLDIMVGSLEDKRRECGDIAVFIGREFRQNIQVALTWNQLLDIRESGCLVARRLNLARPLQDALTTDTITALLENAKEVSEALFAANPPPVCDEQFCFAFLQRRPALESHTERRISLFKMLRQREDHPDYRRILRYLLHGQSDHFDSVNISLLSEDTQREDAFWGKIVRFVLKNTDSEWCYIASELLAELTPRQRTLLGVTTASSNIVETLLLERGETKLVGCHLSRSERAQLLSDIKDETLWERLPYHETMSGGLVSLSTHKYIFLQSATPVPDSLIADIVLLATPPSNTLRDRYRRRSIKEWGSWGTLQVALDKPNPDTYWRELMNAIGAIGKEALNSVDMHNRLRTTAWLPGRTGIRKPVDIICLPAINSELDKLMALPELLGTFYTEDGFLPEVCEHSAYAVVQEYLLPNTEESFEILSACLDGVEAYYLGDLSEISENLGRWVDLLIAFDGASTELLPGLTLLKSLQREEAYHPYIPEIVSLLLKPLPIAIVISTLQELRSAYTAEKGLFAYNAYLSSLVRLATDASHILKAVPLRNRSGHWKSASELSIELPGIHPSDTLEARQEVILASLVAKLPSTQQSDETMDAVEAKVASTATTLRDYFAPWQGLVPREVIGGFLSLWGDEPDVRDLAQEFLGHRWKVSTFRDAIHWKVLTGTIIGSGEDAHEAMRQQRFLLSLHQAEQDRVLVTNLLGEPFHARIAADIDTLYLGRFDDAPVPNHRGKRLCLRQFDPEPCGRQRLVEILRDSAALLLEKTYCQWPDNLETLWNDLNNSEQIDLAVTQDMILDNAFFYFGLLDTSCQEQVRRLRREWDNLRFDAVQERRVSGIPISQGTEKQKTTLLAKLRNLIEHDVTFQAEVLRSVCGKVEQSQYEPISVPFELFQNADDAVVERIEMEPDAVGLERVVICIEPGLLRWMHWGRAINACRSQTLSSIEGRLRGYHLDLCKMLTLSSSDKSGQQTLVTGKFGLGFKSVFLISKQPCAVSGDLGFSIVAGMYPQGIEPSHLTALRKVLEEFSGNDASGGTIIELELRDGIDVEATLSTFRHIAHVQLAFSISIRRIDFVDNGVSEVISWREHSLPGVRSAYTGELAPTRRSGLKPTRALLLRTRLPREGALLLSMDAYGFVPLPESIPTCWVTTPTRSGESGLGIALNAPFQVDVGRIQLAETSLNREVAQQFSEELESVLEDLYTASIEWEQFVPALRLAADADPYRFWASLWYIATRACILGNGVEGAVVRQALLYRGMSRLWLTCRTVPSELSEKHHCLIALSDVRYIVVGILDEDCNLFTSIASWSSLQKRCGSGKAISARRVANTAYQLAIPFEGSEISLLTILGEELPGEGGEVTPGNAQRLAPIITRERLDTMRREDNLRLEGAELAIWLQSRCFLSEAGTYRPGQELLIVSPREEETTDEALRSAFAPPGRLLSRQYSAESCVFFRLCRDRMDAPAELLKEWGLHAVGSDARLAFLRYLLRGELSARITITPLERDSSWLQGLETAGYKKHFRVEEWTQLLGKLGHSLLRQDEIDTNGDTAHAPRRILPLATVHQWWNDHGASYLAAYEARLYPEGIQFLDAIRSDYGGTVEEREAWLGLLLRSSLETLGRSRHEQHQTFLRLAQEKHWIHTLAEDPQGGSFFQQIREHMDGQLQFLEYFHWMKQFLGVSVFAVWVDEYAEAILSVNRTTGPILPDHLFTPRINPLFQRGGPSAPPLQGMLGIGACFLLRELVRIGAVTNKSVYPYCFVPSQRIRKFLEYSGVYLPDVSGFSRFDQSALIHDQIIAQVGDEDSTFALAFDIPFEIIASNRGIWNDLLEVDFVDIPEEDEA